MDFKQYQKEATELVFPNDRDRKENIYLWALGVAGESGEIAEIVKRFARGDYDLAEKKDTLAKEIGDVLWYLSQLARELDLDLEQIAQENLRKIRDRINRGVGQGEGDDR